MPDGPGKYDAEAELVMHRTDADGVLLLVIRGTKGSGFSVKGTWEMHTEAPAILRMVADQIERDIARGPLAPGRHITVMKPKGRA